MFTKQTTDYLQDKKKYTYEVLTNIGYQSKLEDYFICERIWLVNEK